MRFSRILELGFFRPWMITPEAHISLGRLVLSVYDRENAALDRLSMGSVQKRGEVLSASRGMNVITEMPLPTMQIRNGVATIPMCGVMVRGADQIEKSCGFVDVEDVQRDLEEAQASDEVRSIVLDIDSPGGMHNGAAELAYSVAQCAKPVLAWTAGTMASAAYLVGCSANQVYAAPSAMVGSIGSYIALLDASRAYEMAGFKVELFKAGEFKGAGTPGLPLTEAQRAYIQNIVDTANEQFQSHVLAQRPRIDTSTMDGRGFYAADAYRAGMIDGTANSLAEVLKKLTPPRR